MKYGFQLKQKQAYTRERGRERLTAVKQRKRERQAETEERKREVGGGMRDREREERTRNEKGNLDALITMSFIITAFKAVRQREGETDRQKKRVSE